MSEEEILQELNDHLPYDYCRSEGTEDGTYQEWIDEDSWQFQLKLLVENKNKEIERLNKELEFERQIKKEAREYIKSIPDDEFVESEHFTELLFILGKVGEE